MSLGTVLFIAALGASLITSLVLNEQAKNAASAMSDADNITVSDFNTPQMTEGIVVPVVFGFGMVAGNLIWYEAIKENSGSAEFYKYKAWYTICMGEIEEQTYEDAPDVNTFWVDGKPAVYSIRYPFDQLINYHPDPGWVPMPNNILYLGGDDNEKPINSYIDGEFATRLKGIAHCVIGSHKGTVPGITYVEPVSLPQGVTTIPEIKFSVERRPTVPFNIGKHIYEGVNPAICIYDILTNKQWGGGIDSSEINLDGFSAAANHWGNLKFGLNFILNGSTTIKQIILKIQEWTDSFLVKDANDKYTIKLLLDTDAENPVATVTDNDIIKFSLRRKSWEETFNAFTANYQPIETTYKLFRPDPNKPVAYYNVKRNDKVRTATIKNEANIALTGSVRSKVIDLTALSRPVNISYRLNHIMKKESFPYANATLTTNLTYLFVKVGDVIILDLDEYSINAPFRVTSVNFKKISSNEVSFELIQMRELLINPHIERTNNVRGDFKFAELPSCFQTVTFPAHISISNKLSRPFVNDADSVVHFTPGQLTTGMGQLEYGVDYTVVNHRRIQLDETLFANEILFNESGNLSIDVYEKGCPELPES
jgi:hypothetical protein